MCTPKKPSTSLMIRRQVPFEKEVLKFLLEHQAQIVNPVVRDFVRRYINWLYRCANEDIQVLSAGGRHLRRWEISNASYGYDPADVSYTLSKLNQLFFMVMGDTYIRMTQPELAEELPPFNTHLSMELLSSLSCPLGFYVLVRYFQTDAHTQDKAWLERACDLFGELRDLETWRPQRNTIEQSGYIRLLLGTAAAADEPYYYTAMPDGIRDPRTYKLSNVPSSSKKDLDYNRYYEEGFKAGFTTGHQQGYMQCVQETNVLFNSTSVIIEAERKRLVDFLKSLRQTLDMLSDDPLMIEGEWQVVTPANGH